MIKDLINTAVTFVSQEMPINEVVQKMIETKISSVLVCDEREMVVGIITERDIVRKFTLLEMEDKLTRKASTIMSRPLQFISERRMLEEIKEKYIESKIRHFPVLKGKEPKVKNIVGIISVTDVLKYLLKDSSDPGDGGSQTTARLVTPQEKPELAIVTPHVARFEKDITRLRIAGFLTKEFGDLNTIVLDFGVTKFPVIFDGDGYPQQALTKLVPVIRKYACPLLFLTDNPGLAQAFRKLVHPQLGRTMVKPLEIDYWEWFLLNRWQQP